MHPQHLRLSSLAALLLLTSATLPFGHLGSERVVLFLNGFHFVSGNTSQEISANHHCSILFDDFIQCVLYATDTTPTHLAGIEYIISPALFATLPPLERQLWHSHAYEVSSGTLVEPGLPDRVDHSVMEIIVGTHGKTVHSWPYAARNFCMDHLGTLVDYFLDTN